MKSYIVIIVCNFDDVIVGCYDNLREARFRARVAAANPAIRLESEYQGCADTEPILVRILVFQGCEEIASEDLELVQASPEPPKPSGLRTGDNLPVATIGEAAEAALEAFLTSGYRVKQQRPMIPPQGAEFGGELNKHDVDRLVANGYEVSVYHHKGTTATVVTRPR